MLYVWGEKEKRESTTYIFRVERNALARFHAIQADNIQEAVVGAIREFHERYGKGGYEIVEIMKRSLAAIPETRFEVPVTNVRTEDNSFTLTLGETHHWSVSEISIGKREFSDLYRPTADKYLRILLTSSSYRWEMNSLAELDSREEALPPPYH